MLVASPVIGILFYLFSFQERQGENETPGGPRVESTPSRSSVPRKPQDILREYESELQHDATQAEYNRVLRHFMDNSYYTIAPPRPPQKEMAAWLRSLDRKKCTLSVVEALEGDNPALYRGAAELAHFFIILEAAAPLAGLLEHRLQGVPQDEMLPHRLIRVLGHLAGHGSEDAKSFLMKAASIDYWEKETELLMDYSPLPLERQKYETAVSMFQGTLDAIMLAPSHEMMKALHFPENSEENRLTHADFVHQVIRNFLLSGDSIETYRKEIEKSMVNNKYGNYDAYLTRKGWLER